jgi:molybdate/tungstate transport system permease protein
MPEVSIDQRRVQWRGSGLFVLLSAVLLAYLLFPFLAFLQWSPRSSVLAALSEPAAGDAIRHSLLTAPVATVLATIFGVPLAYVLARHSFRGKRLVEALVVLPLVLPPVVAGAMLLTGIGRFTTVGGFFAARGLPLTSSLAGIVLAQLFVAAPFVVITARAGFASVDRRLEQASRSMGYGPVRTFLHVSLPLAGKTVLAGVVLTFARAIGEFGAVLMVANNPRTMPTQIWFEFQTGGPVATVPLAVALLAISLVVILLTQYTGRLSTA